MTKSITSAEVLCAFFILLIVFLILLNRYLNSARVVEEQRLKFIADEKEQREEENYLTILESEL